MLKTVYILHIFNLISYENSVKIEKILKMDVEICLVTCCTSATKDIKGLWLSHHGGLERPKNQNNSQMF